MFFFNIWSESPPISKDDKSLQKLPFPRSPPNFSARWGRFMNLLYKTELIRGWWLRRNVCWRRSGWRNTFFAQPWICLKCGLTVEDVLWRWSVSLGQWWVLACGECCLSDALLTSSRRDVSSKISGLVLLASHSQVPKLLDYKWKTKTKQCSSRTHHYEEWEPHKAHGLIKNKICKQNKEKKKTGLGQEKDKQEGIQKTPLCWESYSCKLINPLFRKSLLMPGGVCFGSLLPLGISETSCFLI